MFLPHETLRPRTPGHGGSLPLGRNQAIQRGHWKLPEKLEATWLPPEALEMLSVPRSANPTAGTNHSPKNTGSLRPMNHMMGLAPQSRHRA